MLEVLTPYFENMLGTILVALAASAVSVAIYAKTVVKTAARNITAAEAEHIAIEVMTAMGDGVMSPEERKAIIIDAINAVKTSK